MREITTKGSKGEKMECLDLRAPGKYERFDPLSPSQSPVPNGVIEIGSV